MTCFPSAYLPCVGAVGRKSTSKIATFDSCFWRSTSQPVLQLLLRPVPWTMSAAHSASFYSVALGPEYAGCPESCAAHQNKWCNVKRNCMNTRWHAGTFSSNQTALLFADWARSHPRQTQSLALHNNKSVPLQKAGIIMLACLGPKAAGYN